MGKMIKKEMPLWARCGHRKPVTRREFLNFGLIPFAARAFVPGALGLLAKPFSAHAAPECPDEGGGLASFVTLNLAGGAGISANFVPRDAGDQLLTSYSKMGMGTAPTMTTEFGSDRWFINNNTGMLVGIREQADPATLANTSVIGVCVQSQDDTNSNKFDLTGLVFKAGLVGSRVPNVGTRASVTGTNQQPAVASPPSPLIVRSFTDILNSIGYTAALNNNTTGLSASQKQKLAKLVGNLSGTQARKFASISNIAHVKELVECAGIKNESLIVNGAGAMDPRNNAEVAARWGVNAGTAANNQNLVFGSMVYNGLLGQAGTVNLDIGGYDYHDGTRTTGDARDRQAGNVIGRILDTARILGRRVFVYVTSDGSVVSTDSANANTAWTSDRGSAGLSLIFMYDPAAKPVITGHQIGHYLNGQVAAENTVVGASPEVSAQAVFANYLAFNNRMDLFGRVVPRGALDSTALAEVIKIGV